MTSFDITEYTIVTEALTTLFTAPPECTNRPFTLLVTAGIGGDTEDVLGWDKWFKAPSLARCNHMTNCYPDYWIGDCASDVPANTIREIGTFSPGACPSDYTMFATAVTDGVTTASCCPRGFSISSNYDLLCSSAFDSATTALATSDIYPSIGTDTDPISFTVTATTTIPSGSSHLAVRSVYKVHWREMELSLFTPASLPLLQLSSLPLIASLRHVTSSSTLLPSLPPSQLASADAGPLNEVNTSTSNSSLAMKIGIGAGVSTGALILLLLIMWSLLRRRMMAKVAAKKNPGATASAAAVSTLRAT